jgi:hypothetical protein
MGRSTMALYTVSVPRIHIESIRSAHKDTLFATMSIRTMNADGGLHQDYPAKTLSLGDHGAKEELHPAFNFPSIDVPDPTSAKPDGGAAYVVFLLVNAGHVGSGYVDVLNKAADAFAGALAGKVVEKLSLATLAGVAAILGVQELVNLLTADCDGVVVSDSFAWTAANLRSMVPQHKNFEVVKGYPGTNSPAGCGDNSAYDVAYDVVRA